MKMFAGQQVEPLFQFSWLVVTLTLLLCGTVALVLGFTVDPRLAVAVALTLLSLLYIFFADYRCEGAKMWTVWQGVGGSKNVDRLWVPKDQVGKD